MCMHTLTRHPQSPCPPLCVATVVSAVADPPADTALLSRPAWSGVRFALQVAFTNVGGAYRQAFMDAQGGFEFTSGKSKASRGSKGVDGEAVYAWARTQIIPYVGHAGIVVGILYVVLCMFRSLDVWMGWC